MLNKCKFVPVFRKGILQPFLDVPLDLCILRFCRSRGQGNEFLNRQWGDGRGLFCDGGWHGCDAHETYPRRKCCRRSDRSFGG